MKKMLERLVPQD